jgi:hypothetical protein
MELFEQAISITLRIFGNRHFSEFILLPHEAMFPDGINITIEHRPPAGALRFIQFRVILAAYAAAMTKDFWIVAIAIGTRSFQGGQVR